MILHRLDVEAYGIFIGARQRLRGLPVERTEFSLPIFGMIARMWRDYQRGILPGAGCREDQNPNLLDAFAVLDAAEARAEMASLKPASGPLKRRPQGTGR